MPKPPASRTTALHPRNGTVVGCRSYVEAHPLSDLMVWFVGDSGLPSGFAVGLASVCQGA